MGLSLFNIKETLQDGNLDEFRIRLTNVMAVIGLVITFFYAGYYLFYKLKFLSIYFFCISLLFLTVLILNRTNRNHITRPMVVTLSILTIGSSLALFGRETEVQVYLSTILILTFLLFDSKKLIALFVGFIFVTFFGTYAYAENNQLAFAEYRLPYDHFINYGYGLIGTTILASILISAIVSYLKQTNESIKRIKDKNKELESMNTVIQKQKNELQLFTAIASHDLKSPIRVMRSFLGLIQKKIDIPESNDEIKRYLEFVSNGAHELDNLIKGISSFRKIGDFDVSSSYSDSTSVLDRVVSQLKSQPNGKFEIIANEIPKLRINGSHLEIIFHALISNGVLFNKSEKKYIKVTSSTTPDQLIIQFKDNGIGIDKQYSNYIFDPFKKLNNSSVFQGSGLGLSNAKKVVELYNGTISLDASQEIGSKFIISFPKEIILS